MKYEYPVIELIYFQWNDIVTLSGSEGDGGEFDPTSF